MSSTPTGTASLARKILPVDVEEQDGRFTRGFVQDVFHDGKVLLHLDCANNPLLTVEPDRIFRSRELTVLDPELEEDLYFGVGTEVEALFRIFPRSSARWYPGTIVSMGCSSVPDVAVDGEAGRRGLFETDFQSGAIQWPFVRVGESYVKRPVNIPNGIDTGRITETFCAEFEKYTGSMVHSVDLERRQLMVLATEDHALCTDGTFGKIFGKLDGSRMSDAKLPKKKKREVTRATGGGELGTGSSSSGWKQETASNVGETELRETAVALTIPDMLVAVVRLLDLKDRQILRGVSRFWKDINESIPASRTAHFDDSRSPLPTALGRFRYLSKVHQDHLTSIAVHCSSDEEEYSCECTFVSVLSFAGPVLLPQLKTLVLYSGHVETDQLKAVLLMKNAPRIFLKNVTVHPCSVEVFVEYMHARVKCGVLDPGLIASVALSDIEEESLRPRKNKAQKATVFMQNFLVKVLDSTPLECSEDHVLAMLATVKEGETRDELRNALKTLEPGCFKPEMDVSGTEIRLPKSLLRISTLLICKAIVEGYPYRCADLSCCPDGAAKSDSD